jgi:ataxia telangiectasia mutated family protein
MFTLVFFIAIPLLNNVDDIRQDAIIQQVFQNVNALFRFQDPSSDGAMNQQMDLKLHTYTCIPLTPKTGVIEWVANTTSFGDFLYRSGRKLGAHEKYYPGEWDVSLCRNHASCSPKDKKRASYDTICKNFSPCFRYFFLERFSHSPQRWHDARMSYIRSCAVNSIVGHVLGIGDRHSHNILIHEKTGEVVHIDFGIVFEQGKVRL